jgi:hypothetical protein
MDIGEAIKALKDGKHIRDPRWSVGQFLYSKNGQILRVYPDRARDYCWCPTTYDLLRTDYEVVND